MEKFKLPTKNITESELDSPVYRYLTFTKFISLLTYNALWFSKLNVLQKQDAFEGKIPLVTDVRMKKEHQEEKVFFNSPELHRQIDEWNLRNEEDGAELIAANCWYQSNEESKAMWEKYVGTGEGLAIKSTIKKLSENIYVETQYSVLGKVQYVDMNNHNMSSYKAHQAIERAFLKDESLKNENEIRIATMSFKTPNCINMTGERFSQEDYSGKNMNNFENPGLYVVINIDELIEEIVLAPDAPKWFEHLVRRIVVLSKLKCNVVNSKI